MDVALDLIIHCESIQVLPSNSDNDTSERRYVGYKLCENQYICYSSVSYLMWYAVLAASQVTYTRGIFNSKVYF